MGYLLSIVIPTKDRYLYLKHFISLVDTFATDEVELVIQDNTLENTEIIDFLDQKDFSFVKYFHESTNLSIVQNSDLAILHSSGEYVCYMGDDDAVMPNIVHYTKWMKKNCIDALKSSDIIYYWPDTKPGRHISNSGKLIFKKYSKNIINRNPKDALLNVLRKGCLNKGNIPVVYHGIVKRSILDICYEQAGTFFPAPCPDMANGVAMSLMVNNYAYVDEPIVISGASKHHGGKSAIKQKYLHLDDMFWMSDKEKQEWDMRVLRYGVAESIYLNTVIKALSTMGRADLINDINFLNNYASQYVNYRELRKQVLSLVDNKFLLYYYSIPFWYNKVKNKLKSLLELIINKALGRVVVGPFSSIFDAIKYLQEKYTNEV